MWSDGAEEPGQHGSFAAAVEAELRTARLDLTFSPFLETRYQKDQADQRLAALRRLSPIGGGISALLLIAISALLPAGPGPLAVLIACLLLAAFAAGLRLLFRSAQPAKRREAGAAAFALLSGLLPALALLWGGLWHGAAPSDDTLVLATLGTAFLPLLPRFHIRRAAILSGTSLLLYAVILLLTALPVSLVAFPLLCAAVLALLALFALHALEQAARRLYLHELLQKTQGERSAAFIDPLTGLPNRERMDAALSALCNQEDVRASFLMVDIDLFQDFNEQYGHAIGDRLLHDLGRCLTAALRDGDLLARMGGEEFGVLLNGLVMQDAILVAERLRAAVAAFPFLIGTRLVKMTVSIGVTGIIPCDEPSRILDSAEKGMHLAKRAGRNQVGGPWLKLPS